VLVVADVSVVDIVPVVPVADVPLVDIVTVLLVDAVSVAVVIDVSVAAVSLAGVDVEHATTNRSDTTPREARVSIMSASGREDRQKLQARVTCRNRCQRVNEYVIRLSSRRNETVSTLR